MNVINSPWEIFDRNIIILLPSTQYFISLLNYQGPLESWRKLNSVRPLNQLISSLAISRHLSMISSVNIANNMGW